MNISSLSRLKKESTVHMSTRSFDALDTQAYDLFKQPGSTTLYRLGLTHDQQGVQIVPVAEKNKLASPRALALPRKGHGRQARHSLRDFMQRLCKHAPPLESERANEALVAVLALPHKFDHRALHLALRSVSTAQLRDAIATTSAKVLDCVGALNEEPHRFGPVPRPVSPSCADAKEVDDAVSQWCKAFKYEYQLLTQTGARNEGDQDVQALWDRLFALQFGIKESGPDPKAKRKVKAERKPDPTAKLTAGITPPTLLPRVFERPVAEVERLHNELQALVQAGQGKGATPSTCSAWMRASEAVIAAVVAYIQRLAIGAQALFELSTKRPETEPAMEKCRLPSRHRDLWQNLARVMLDQACAALQPGSHLMNLLNGALSCRRQALLAQDTAAAEASAAQLIARVQALPQAPALDYPSSEEQERANTAYSQSMDAVEDAERRLNRHYRPPLNDGAAQETDTALARRLQELNTQLQGQGLVKDVALERLWPDLIDQPIAQLHALMLEIHSATRPSDAPPGPTAQQRVHALCQQFATELPRLLNRVATVAGLLASEARSVLLSSGERERLLALAQALLAFARALLDPAGRHMAYHQDAKLRLAGAPH